MLQKASCSQPGPFVIAADFYIRGVAYHWLMSPKHFGAGVGWVGKGKILSSTQWSALCCQQPRHRVCGKVADGWDLRMKESGDPVLCPSIHSPNSVPPKNGHSQQCRLLRDLASHQDVCFCDKWTPLYMAWPQGPGECVRCGKLAPHS